MKATEAKLLTFLQKSTQFIIPIYQRTYSWTEKQCRQLWDDILRAGSNDTIAVHFIGSIVYIEQGLSMVSHRAPLLVIDGHKEASRSGYTIDDHPYLVTGSDMFGTMIPDLFKAFRKEVLALDPCVTEEFLKLCVAYKAETNFVDVVPQAKRLRLSINLPFADINDPRGLCQDVTNRGRWGNGDVEIGLSSLEELPYVMSLVRQAYEAQMGNGGQS